MKNVFYAFLLALLSIVHVHGAHDTPSYGKNEANLVDQIKFGVGFSVSSPQKLFPFNGETESFMGNKPLGQAWPSIGAFGEYLLSDRIGLRLSLGYDSKAVQSAFGMGTSFYSFLEDGISKAYNERFRDKMYALLGEKGGAEQAKVFLSECVSVLSERYTTMSLNYLTIAPTLRMYLGKTKQFCVFMGPKFGYLVRAKCTYYDSEGENTYDLLAEDELEELSKKNIYMKDTKMRRCVWGITFGWDYESKHGLILSMLLGGEVGISGTVVHDTSEKPILFCKNNVVSTLQLFSIGYNFAKLL
jgi:hypothetical protein